MKRVFKTIILILIIGILLYTMYEIYQENKLKRKAENSNYNESKISSDYGQGSSENAINNNEIKENDIDSNEIENKVEDELNINLGLVPEKYKGKNVVAKLKIEKLKIDTCVLEEYSKANLDICVTKFFGCNANEVGNFCIAGHNYITNNMFGYLKWLKIGDAMTLTDNKHGEVKYEIYDTYRAKSNETGRTYSKN